MVNKHHGDNVLASQAMGLNRCPTLHRLVSHAIKHTIMQWVTDCYNTQKVNQTDYVKNPYLEPGI